MSAAANRQSSSRLKSRPLQVRSEQTLQRVLAAAESLLDDKPFEAITMAELARHAGVAVGTIYTRFEGREALLPYLYEKYAADLQRDAAEALDPEQLAGVALEARIRLIVEYCVDLYRKRRGLWRAIALYAIHQPQAISDTHRTQRRGLLDRCGTLLLECADEINHPDPRAAVSFAMGTLSAVCKDRILFAESTRGIVREVSDKALRQELAQMLTHYLTGHPERGRRGRGGKAGRTR